MKFSLGLLMLFPFLIAAETERHEATQPEIIQSDDYSTRRFREVVDSHMNTEPKSPQEELISLRAKLIIAERQWNELKEARPDPANTESTPRPQLLRAAQAKMNHYQVKISRLEERILREKRKEREQAAKTKKKKK